MRIINTLLLLLLFMHSTKGQTLTVTSATLDFISTLNSAEKELCLYEFENSNRTEWNNQPVGIIERPGLRYGDLSSKSKISFQQVLITVLSSQGYLKTNNIMHIDDYLYDMYVILYNQGLMTEEEKAEIDTLEWGHGNYYIAIWGHPEDDKWSLKFEGHHISLNITVIEDQMTLTPLFMGSDPALVRLSKFAGMRPMSKEEDYGLELMNMLTEEQKQIAIISEEVPQDIITSPDSDQRLANYQGIKGSELTEVQQQQLEFLILEYVGNFERAQKEYYLNLIESSGLDEVYFAWIGGTERVTDHYYAINGPDFLIEYDNVGWVFQGDHVHTIFREKKNDFGEDLLKNHYLKHKH